MLSVRFARALAKGRGAAAPPTRPRLLASLLRKRATAHARGDMTLESMLRDQIRWSLPVERGD